MSLDLFLHVRFFFKFTYSRSTDPFEASQVKNSFPDINKYKAHVQESMSKLGLRVKFSKNAFRDNYGGLAGNDTERSSDLMDMFRDPEVKAIIANRGGWGCNRILDMVTSFFQLFYSKATKY